MKYLMSITLLFFLVSTMTHAEDVGIDFESMKPGTRLTTKTRGSYEVTYIEEYVGRNGGLFQTQTYKLEDDGSLKKLNLSSYDESGRKLNSTLNGKTNTYSPYSCHYVIGKCTHTYRYYNLFTKKFVSNESRFENRLDGDTFYVGVIPSNGEKFEVPYKLGPHRLRVSSRHKNKLGKLTGHEFVALQVPE